MSTSEVDSRNISISMRKSVENLVISSQEVIGQSLNNALNYQIVHEIRNVSRSPSPSQRTSESAAETTDNDKGSEVLSASYQTSASGSGSASASGESAAPAGDSLPALASRPDPAKQGPNSLPKVVDGSVARSKKKSWYNALYPTYKSKSDDFKRIFKDLPEDERLIVDYSCALQKDILAHGRLYASQSYLCFYASIFGWETSLSIRWKDVTAITKEKTALVIPNAILVCTDGEKNFLTSFSGRDKAYLMLFRIWQNALMDQPMTSQEIWQWVHTCYGEELGFNSDEEGYPRDVDEPAAISDGPAEVFVSFTQEGSEPSMEAGGAEGRARGPPRDTTPPHALANGEAEVRGEEGGEALPTDMSDTTDTEPDKHNGSESEQCTDSHDGKLLLQREFPFPVDQMFTMIFTNSKFSVELLAARDIRDYVQAEWRAAGGVRRRQVSYTQQITTGPLGPKEVHVTETQVVNKCSKAGTMYSIDASSENSGIPYADYFSVEVHYCLRRVADAATALRLYVKLKYKKSMWQMVKGFVEKNTIERLEEFARLLEARLLAEARGPAPAKRPARRRRRHTAGAPEPVAAVVTAPPCTLPPRAARSPARAPTTPWLVGILVLLLAINGLLYWQLHHAEHADIDFEDLQNRMSAASGGQLAEWAHVLRAHADRRRGELRAWRDALAAALAHLAQTEQALTKLLETIKPSLERAQEEAQAAQEEAQTAQEETQTTQEEAQASHQESRAAHQEL